MFLTKHEGHGRKLGRPGPRTKPRDSGMAIRTGMSDSKIQDDGELDVLGSDEFSYFEVSSKMILIPGCSLGKTFLMRKHFTICL